MRWHAKARGYGALGKKPIEVSPIWQGQADDSRLAGAAAPAVKSFVHRVSFRSEGMLGSNSNTAHTFLSVAEFLEMYKTKLGEPRE